MAEIVAVTYAFTPAPEPAVQAVRIRLSGHRQGVSGRPRSGDRFTAEETVEDVVAGSGPVAVTARVRGVNPGEWRVTAKMVEATGLGRHGSPEPIPKPQVLPVRWSWRRWRVSATPAGPVHSCLPPLARVPGLLVGSWLGLTVLGTIAALVIQTLIFSALEVSTGRPLLVSLLMILVGVVGAKLWYLVDNRGNPRRNAWWLQRLLGGWCVQGFIAGDAVAAVPLLVATGTPVGTFLDVTAPGLMVGLAIGRLGCFFIGCCSGRPTASRWGVWSTDGRLGMRRVPTQLMESGLGLAIGLGTLAAILYTGPRGGALLVAALAAYTLVRQGILRMRSRRRRSRLGGPLTAAAAAIVLLVDTALLIVAAS